jgi:phosphotransferase system HPr-like phosphotransfer protein
MGMMSLGAIMGDSVTISAEGADEEAAVNSIADYLTGNDK